MLELLCSPIEEFLLWLSKDVRLLLSVSVPLSKDLLLALPAALKAARLEARLPLEGVAELTPSCCCCRFESFFLAFLSFEALDCVAPILTGF